MSVLPSSEKYMGLSLRNREQETFHNFFECWLYEQSHHLEELTSAAKQPRNGEAQSSQFNSLVGQVIHHYEQYYRAKAHSAGEDVLRMFSPTWTSSLEDAFHWIGGWRPSMAFHLLYSKTGSQTEAALAELMRGLKTEDLADLSSSQLVQVDELQRRTIREEKEIDEKIAKHQETVADSSMVELSHEVTEMMTGGGGPEHEEKVDSALAPKEEGLKDMLRMADDLRLRTLKGVVGILSPVQAVHFLIAAAELHLRVHEWGKKRETKQTLDQRQNGNEFH